MRLTCLLALMLAPMAQALWYEAQGRATIDGDIDRAREAATQDALRNAQLYAGMEISSSQRVDNGVLTEEQVSWNSSSNVRAMRLIDEIRDGNLLTVTIHADLVKGAESCENPKQTRKRLTISRFDVAQPLHLQQGGLFSIGEASRTSMRLFLENSGSSTLSVVESGGAYRVDGSVIDAALIDDYGSAWNPWAEAPQRGLNLEIKLTDLTTEEVLLNQRFIGQAPWPFERTETVDPSTARYWRSTYGEMHRSLIEQAGSTIRQVLACRPLAGVVVHIRNQRLWLNLGQKDGIRVGQRLKLYKTRQFTEADGRLSTVLLPAPVTVVVAGVEPERSYVDMDDASALAGFQAGDRVIEP